MCELVFVPSDDRLDTENEALRERVAEFEARLESGDRPDVDGVREAADD